MSAGPQGASPKGIRLIVSDIDGTLLDQNKELTPRAKEAALRVEQAGYKFTVISARPPRALVPIIRELNITAPVACFNGAMICSPSLEIVAQKLMAQHCAVHVAQLIVDHGLDLWAFVGTDWYASEVRGAHTAHHIELIGPPKQLSFTLEICARAAKIVGVSDDREKMAACEAAIRNDHSLDVAVSRSSAYYLDVTHPEADKGHAVEELARLNNVSLDEVATLGDMPNDVLMFARSRFSVAMGQSDDAVKRAATAVTASNSEEGFARAIEKYFLDEGVEQ